ncbi:MAG TPA: alpha/beta hydrolase [Feifaniaceae bacterium]|nr:alpha/beta hydrolase [Feifaniaceae bacterium]
MSFDPVREDAPEDVPCRSPKVTGVTIACGTGERLSGTLFTVDADIGHPVALLLHGYPGYETNFDLAHALQRAGCAVLAIHYRGTWGSDGLFRLGGAVEDVHTSIDFLKDNAALYGWDKKRISLIGHSTGGFAAFAAAAAREDLSAVVGIAPFDFSLAAARPETRAVLREEFSDTVGIDRVPLEAFFSELDARAGEWSFPALARGLSSKSVYLVGAARDDVSPPELHIEPLYRALLAQGGSVEYETLDTTHCFSSKRLALIDTVLSFLRTGQSLA